MYSLISSCLWMRSLQRSRYLDCVVLYSVITSTNLRDSVECCRMNRERERPIQSLTYLYPDLIISLHWVMDSMQSLSVVRVNVLCYFPPLSKRALCPCLQCFWCDQYSVCVMSSGDHWRYNIKTSKNSHRVTNVIVLTVDMIRQNIDVIMDGNVNLIYWLKGSSCVHL